MKKVKAALFLLFTTLEAVHPIPIAFQSNSNATPSLINSIAFHPEYPLCCATYTHNNQLQLFTLDDTGQPHLSQVLKNPITQLGHPQHALFSPDGSALIVSNWKAETFTVYHRLPSGLYREKPSAQLPFPKELRGYKPHGMAFSPCRNYLAVAYGASLQYPRGIALYRLRNSETETPEMALSDLLLSDAITTGIPKGVAFTPDGAALVVTFSETNALAIYPIDREEGRLHAVPKQLLSGATTGLSRPEDIAFFSDGSYCAVSNSCNNTITFYAFRHDKGGLIDGIPIYTMQNPEARLSFPHGLAFSSDGHFLAVTQFGPVSLDDEGRLHWPNRDERSDGFTIYKLQ